VQHLVIADPAGHLGEQHIVPNTVEVGSQIKIDHVRLPHRNRVGDPDDRLLS
jgi:hypothetical protein